MYVSSAFEDLKAFRRAVYEQPRKLRIDTVAMEDYVAGEKRPLAKCIEPSASRTLPKRRHMWGLSSGATDTSLKEGNPEARSPSSARCQRSRPAVPQSPPLAAH